MNVLGIETSCDETGVAIYNTDKGLLAHRLYSQIALHAEYGGVVPELASRDHIRKLNPLLNETLKEAGLEKKDLDAIAYTQGPGLMGALLVGTAFSRALAYALGIPAVPVHHMEGHLLAPMLAEDGPAYPFVALLVSGGHTQLMQVARHGHYELLGESLDDAVGEAFDKTAQLLELGYPGGPALAQLAEQGDKSHFKFPRPMTDRPGLDFSFSGLKTFAINTLQAHQSELNVKENIAAAFQEAVVETLIIKCRRAMEQTGYSTLIVAGGVGANVRLRERLVDEMAKRSVKVNFPAMSFCTDNGAMIAYAGALRLLQGQQQEELAFAAKPRWPMMELGNVSERPAKHPV